MNKYTTLFTLSWQKQLEVRSEFLFERMRSLSILISIYFLWNTVLAGQSQALGYERAQLLTYVLLMTLLRAWVLGCVTDRIPMEIAKGKISELLLKPFSNLGYWAVQDLASKSLNLVFAFFEVGIFALIVSSPFYVPHGLGTWIAFILATMGGMIIYFQMSYLLGVMGFWAAQSWGPRFCFEVILEFCAGAYFPIDFLPVAFQKILALLPFPYLIYYPVSIYLGRLSTPQVVLCLITQVIWITALSYLAKYGWKLGLRRYAAEGG